MTTKTMLGAVLGLPEVRLDQFSLGHCSVTRLSGSELGLRIDSINESLCAPVGRASARPRPAARPSAAPPR